MSGRILVTGGCGFIGSAVARELISRLADVTVVDDLSAGALANLPASRQLRFVEADVTSRRALRPIVAGHDAVIHLSALPYVPDSWRRERAYWRQNTVATETVLEAASGEGVARVVLASTAEVYGGAAPAPVAEDYPMDPMSPYARSKAAAEEIARTFQARGLSVVILRLFNAFGPREGWPFVVPELIRQFSKEDEVRIGSEDSRRDFTFVTDTARAIVAAVSASDLDAATINVGSGSSFSVGEIAALVAAELGADKPMTVDPDRVRTHDPANFVADPSVAEQVLGWAPTVSFEDGLRKTIRWYRESGRQWLYERRARASGSAPRTAA